MTLFFEIRFKKTFKIVPEFLGPQLRRILHDTVRKQLEGFFFPEYGTIICVTGIESGGKARIDDATPYVHVPCSVTAIVSRPFTNAIVEGKVTEVAPIGIYVLAAHEAVFVSSEQMGEAYMYDETSGAPQFKTIDNNEDRKIGVGDKVRLAVSMVQSQDSGFQLMGRLRADDLLGRVPSF
jgi:DNA-directed RNA polymerase subunit E'/Rpb7